MFTRIDFDVTCLILQHSLKLQRLGLVDYYCQQQLNGERIHLHQVVTARFSGQPQSKWRDGSNKNYLCTKCAFHGYKRGNFWSKEIACRERMAQNRCCGVIISIQSLVFCVEELLQPQAKPVFGVIIMRKKLTKIQNFLPLQPWPQCPQSKLLLQSWK